MKHQAGITMVQLTDDGNADAAIERMPRYFEEARQAGSDIVVFPEYVLGNRISTQHPRVQRFLALAREHGIYAIAGMVETHGDKWATTALVADREGNLLGRAMKSHPACGPGPHWWPPMAGSDSEARGILGHQFKVFHLDFGPIGILQCYDGYFPESWGCMSFEGAEIVLWINGREGQVEDAYCIFPSNSYGIAVGANISNGANTGFATPWGKFITANGIREEARLFPRVKERGDACVHATIDLAGLRNYRKHLRTMHQRRPELYGRLTQEIRMWQDYPDIPWDFPECAAYANKSTIP